METQSEQVSPSKQGGHGWMVWLVVVVLGTGGYFGYRWYAGTDDKAHAGTPTTQPARVMPVVVATAHRRDLPIYLNGLGTVTALNTVTVRSRVDGQLLKVDYTEGQEVKQDQVLAEVDPRAFQVQLEQAEGQYARDQALLKNAKLDLARYESARDAVPQQQVDTAASVVGQYEGATKTDQAAIDNAKLQLGYTHITAPISGKIGLRLVDQGNMVHAGDANGLAVITQVQPIAIVFSLPQDDLSQILKATDRNRELAVDAYSRDMSEKIAVGKLLAVDNQIDTSTATAKLKAVFDNKDRTLFPNQFVNVRMLVNTIHDAVVVPTAAIQRSPQGMFVYVVKSDQTVENRTVTLGPSEGDFTTIEQGLAENEIVVTDGVDKLRPGMSVTTRDERRRGESTTGPSTRRSREGKSNRSSS